MGSELSQLALNANRWWCCLTVLSSHLLLLMPLRVMQHVIWSLNILRFSAAHVWTPTLTDIRTPELFVRAIWMISDVIHLRQFCDPLVVFTVEVTCWISSTGINVLITQYDVCLFYACMTLTRLINREWQTKVFIFSSFIDHLALIHGIH